MQFSKKMRSEYENIFSFIKSTINKLDPIGLLNRGAPEDEYDHEIAKIASGLRTCNKVEDVQELIYKVFKENFGNEIVGSKKLYVDAAKDIFILLRKDQ